MNRERILAAYEKVRDALLAERKEHGHWTGHLASSALSTATALSALCLYRKNVSAKQSDTELASLLERSVQWLLADQHDDGGWGDTAESPSNISTSILVRCALEIYQTLQKNDERFRETIIRVEHYIQEHGGIENIQTRYGSDRTFSIPILTNAALAGLVPWDIVPPLPFELAWFPQSFFRILKLPVVSYAIPALVAIGLVNFEKKPPNNPIVKAFRRFAKHEALKKVRNMQPKSGGFLEAAPLTAFVVMSLCESGLGEHPIVQHGVRFLLETVREDASWPVDTNLACWGTTLSINALSVRKGPEETETLNDPELWKWVLSVQQREKHPFTGAAPGGWAWTDLSGGVPDVDDTSGAVLALSVLDPLFSEENQNAAPEGIDRKEFLSQVGSGLDWLFDLQNKDGGWPTFCRGWNRFPFDRSGVDLSAHALRALMAWWNILRRNRPDYGERVTRIDPPPIAYFRNWKRTLHRGLDYILRTQTSQGAWCALWFGNQYHTQEENPIYGTAKVLRFLAEARTLDLYAAKRESIDEAICKALRFCANNQNKDGGFGGHVSSDTFGQATYEHFSPDSISGIEETASVVDAIASFVANGDFGRKVPELDDMYEKSLHLLLTAVEKDRYRDSEPIGLYFTKLWYDEKLYPIIFTCSALAQALRTDERMNH